MEINESLTDDAVLRELGTRIAAVRLAHNLTQAQLAAEAGISKRTLERLESGAVAAQLSALLRVCRALGLLQRLNLLVPEPAVSPIAQLKLQGRARKRASGQRSAAKETSPTKWTWGEP